MKFEHTDNKKFSSLLGREVGIAFPLRNGERVLAVVDAENRRNCLFYTTPIVSVRVDSFRDRGIIRISTKNSEYVFTRETREYYEELAFCSNGDNDTVIVNKNNQLADWSSFRPGDRLHLVDMPFDKNGRHATGDAIFKFSLECPRGYWADEYDEEG